LTILLLDLLDNTFLQNLLNKIELFKYKGYDTKVSMSPILSLWYKIYQQQTPNIDAMCILSDIRKKKK
jgi:hypothetical protein